MCVCVLRGTVTTLSKLKGAIRKKWSGLLKSGVLVDNNARPSSATASQIHIATLVWERLYLGPELAPSNFQLFLALKKNLT
ncbi:hypothetical protein TNCV_89421 [Trichonephila clavipes]|nr:hypothetical protein TNCV_89421 [Trichonephila clavipes]